MLRTFVLGLGALVLGALAASPALAADEELFILDNGSVLRGEVVRESEQKLTIAMSGVVGTVDVTVELSAIVERHVVRSDNPRSFVVETSEALEPPAEPVGRPVAVDAAGIDWLGAEELPEEEPTPQAETYVDRIARLVRVALPDTQEAKVTLGFFLLVVLLILLSWGAKLADIPSPSLLNAGALSLLFGLLFGADLLFPEALLRADRAVWVVTAQIGLWVAASRALLGGTIARAVLLFTFVVSGLLAVIFVTGAIFVTV